MHIDRQSKRIGTAIFGLFILLSVFNGCMKATRYSQASSRLNEAADEAFKDFTPEQLFSRADQKPESVQAYVNLLDRLDRKCTENHNEIGMMVFSLNKENREAGFSESYWDTLSTYTQAAESGFETTGSCIEVYSHLRPEND